MKKIFVLLLLFLFVLSCNNNILKPKDYSKEEIDKKYPYWKVGIERFQIDGSEKRYTVLTVEEKRFTLRCMALMRLVVNTQEFASAVINTQGKIASGEDASFGKYTIKKGDLYDAKRVIEVIRTLEKDFVYEKSSKNQGGGLGTLGASRYVFYGQKPENQIFTGDWVCFQNQEGKTWISWNSDNINNFAPLMFHEHMHNIGFNHVAENKDKDVPYTIHPIVGSIGGRILSGDLKDKYSKQLDELTAYYLTEYKDLLTEDTVFDPNKK